MSFFFPLWGVVARTHSKPRDFDNPEPAVARAMRLKNRSLSVAGLRGNVVCSFDRELAAAGSSVETQRQQVSIGVDEVSLGRGAGLSRALG